MSPDTNCNSNTPCAYPECTRTVWKDTNGTLSSYCGRAHRDAMASASNQPPPSLGSSMCKNCTVRPVYVDNGRSLDFCGRQCAAQYKSAVTHNRRTGEATATAGPQNTENIPPPPPGPDVCKNCAMQPVYVDNGRPLDFCGKRCATQYMSTDNRSTNDRRPRASAETENATPSPPPSPDMCKNCTKRPVYVDNGRPLDFCGRRCLTQHKSVGSQPEPSSTPQPAPPVEECKLAHCHRPVHVDSAGISAQYCSQTHRRQAVETGEAEACLLCEEKPKATFNGKESDFCSKACRDDAILGAPVIYHMPPNSEAFQSVVKQFEDKWLDPNKLAGTVLKVWKIYCTKPLNDAFVQYRSSVERSRGLAGGNTRRRFHGTIRACRLGDDDRNRDLCSVSTCSTCSIIRTSFKVAKSGGRFDEWLGRGIYTSSTSSNSDDYVQNTGRSRNKAMLLNHVVMGKTIKLKQGDASLTKPPAGYDSVVGEPGKLFAHDEAVVYTNDAIRPVFLIVYQ